MMILLPMMAMADAVKINGIYYNLIEKAKEAEVTHGNWSTTSSTLNDGRYSGSIEIPSTIEYEGTTYTVTSVGYEAFASCDQLELVVLPNSINSIGNRAFSFCKKLYSINLGSNLSVIGQFSFSNCESLTSIRIPGSVNTIDVCAFYNCFNLVSAEICDGVQYIGQESFENCTSLTSISIPNSVVAIQGFAFNGCSALLKAMIGSGIKLIRSQAFAKCAVLTDVYCYAENAPTTASDAFQNSYPNYITLHVPAASVDLYKETEPWKNFKSIVGLEDPATEKCSTPTIQVVDGKLKFVCETEGVTFKTTYKIVDSDNNAEGDELVVGGTATCQVSVYATKEGYADSDAATTNITIAWGKKGDVNADGEVNVGDIVTTTNIMAGKDE